MFGLPPTFWTTGAPWGLVGLFVLFMLLGRIRTRAELKERIAERERDWTQRLDEAKAHGAQWEAMVGKLLTLSDRRSDEMDKLLAGNQVMEGMLRALTDRARTGRAQPALADRPSAEGDLR